MKALIEPEVSERCDGSFLSGKSVSWAAAAFEP
jgi:hypothetical protein